MTGPRSEALFERAWKVIPGGVNSPVRAFQSVGGSPYFVTRAQGASIWDADGVERRVGVAVDEVRRLVLAGRRRLTVTHHQQVGGARRRLEAILAVFDGFARQL